MAKILYGLSFALLLSIGCRSLRTTESLTEHNNIDKLIAGLNNPNSKYVLVAAHRGDWRNAPENSIQGLKNCITMGVDVMETDLKMTKDNVLILMHDKTIDRSTNGKGSPENYTLEEIRKFKLKNGLGRASGHPIPTFREFLEVAKGKILINIDKGYAYLPQVIKLLRETGTLQQAVINIDDNTTFDEVEKRYGKIPADVMLMPVVVYKDKEKAHAVVKSYLRHKKTIFQPVWDDDTQVSDEDFVRLKKGGYGVWINSLWPSLNGGHDDDKAVEQNAPYETWGWLVEKGGTTIQTDRPKELLLYLKKKKLHYKF